MFKNIRARINSAYAILFGFLLIFAGAMMPTVANAGYYGGGFRAYSSPRVYVAPRMVVAPRAVYVAPRPVIVARPLVVVVRPRPVIIMPPPLIPYVAPTVTVPADGQPVPGVVVVHHSSFASGLYVFLLILVVVLIFSGVGYGVYYVNPFGWWGAPVVYGGYGGYGVFDGGVAVVDSGVDIVVDSGYDTTMYDLGVGAVDCGVDSGYDSGCSSFDTGTSGSFE